MKTGFKFIAFETRAGQSSASPSGITPVDAAKTMATPNNANVIPTEQSIMYFHAASVARSSL